MAPIAARSLIDHLDRGFYGLLGDVMADHRIGVHAYVFMGNHVHRLLTPPELKRYRA